MGHALLVYNDPTAAAAAVFADFTAATDSDFTQRNGHYTFTEPYLLAGVCLIGASVTQGRIQSPTLNAIGEFNIGNMNRSATVPANPQWDNWLPRPVGIPLNEELQIQASNNLGTATEVESAVLLLLTQDWSAQLPPGQLTMRIRGSFTVTPTANAWSFNNALTLSQSLRGGVYAVIGAQVVGANALAFRVNFPRYKLYSGRKLRPGGLISAAIGNNWGNNRFPFPLDLGEWGRFHTFELPTIDIYGLAATSTTYTVYLDVVYLGSDLSLLQGGLGGGGVTI